MKVYTDIFNQEQVLSDAYNIEEPEEYQGAVMFVKSNWDNSGSTNIDIGCGDAFGGADEEEKVEDEVGERKLNIVAAFNLQETNFSKKDYQSLLKVYMPKLKKHLEDNKPDRVQPCVAGLGAFIKWFMPQFADFAFWTGPNYDTEGMIILSYYKGEDETPTFIYFTDGFEAMKY